MQGSKLPFIPVNELWERLNPAGFERGLFAMMLWGYIDESSDAKPDLFSLSVFLASGVDWFAIERDWLRVLEGKNTQLASQGRPEISRYHAADCSSRKNEFSGWDVKRDQIPFVRDLLRIVHSYPSRAYGYTLSLRELAKEIPETAKNPEGFARVVLLQGLMVNIGDYLLKATKDATVSLIFEQSNSKNDQIMSSAFDQALKTEKFPYRTKFCSITKQYWKNCVPLQVADLIAYEHYKESERHIQRLARQRRKSLDVLLNEGVGVFDTALSGFTDATFTAIRGQIAAMDEQTRTLLYATARIS